MKETAATGCKAPSRRHWIELGDLNWWIVCLFYMGPALLSAATVYTLQLAEYRTLSFKYPLLWQLTGYSTALALAPLLVLGFSRVEIRRENAFWTVPTHIAISVGFGCFHTELMYLTRSGLYHLLGWGAYDYGDMWYRLLMEYSKQGLHYWGLYAVLRVVAYHRQNRERERQAAALELKASELQGQLARVQLQALRSQLNPHFLFNTLNMVSSVMYENVHRADHMIAALSRMLRMSLEQDAAEQVTVRRELEFVRCAVELAQARFGEKLAVEIDCDQNALEEQVPNMLVHTLVENAIKHHDFESESVVRVRTWIERNASTLDIHVEDNGPGIEDLGKAMTNGVGLSNTRRRLMALYGEDHQFELQNRPEGGLHVHVSLPAPVAAVAQPA